MQLDLPLSPAPRPGPHFASEADFVQALASWQTKTSAAAGRLRAARIETPLGTMVTLCSPDAVYLLEFADRPELAREMAELARAHGKILPGRSAMARRLETELSAYFDGQMKAFTVPLVFTGSDFARDVWTRLCAIPFGTTTSYGAMAEQMGRPTATRAVARANGANRIAIVVPCHRVIGADGTLTGYAGGLGRKRALLALEARSDRSP